MKQPWIIGMLALINFLVGTSQFIIVGILDKIAASMGITIGMAGQLVTAFALASAFGSPPFVILVSRRPKNEHNGRAAAMSYISMGFSASLTIPLLHGLQGDDGRAYR